MRLKDKYLINDLVWAKVTWAIKLVLMWIPFSSSAIAFITWPIITNLSWAPPIIVFWILFCIAVILFHRILMVRSKYTMFMIFACGVSYDAYFMILSSSSVYRFFGINGVYIQNLLLVVAGIFICKHYFFYWDKVWESHKKHNESTILDLENSRYDFINNFDMSEDKIKKSKTYSNPALVHLASIAAPMGVAIPIIFSKHGDYTTPIIIMWVLSIPFILGLLKVVVAGFYNFHKLAYYEKKIGKPIINGLLE